MSVNQTVKPHPPIFSLKQQNPDCYYIGVTHSFPAQEIAPDPSGLPTTALPAFNADRSHFTPAFCLTADRDYYRLNLQFQRQKFQLKVHQAQAELSNSDMQIVEPAPNFCQICRASYESYSEHIRERIHSRALAQTKGNRWICDAVAAWTRKEKQIKREGKGRASKTQPQGMTRVKKKEQHSCNDPSLSRTSNPSLPDPCPL